jgi:hypothetical protein
LIEHIKEAIAYIKEHKGIIASHPFSVVFSSSSSVYYFNGFDSEVPIPKLTL